METAKTVMRNVMMAILLLTAIFSTFYAITGLLPSDFNKMGKAQATSPFNGPKLLSKVDDRLAAKPLTFNPKSQFADHLTKQVSLQETPSLDQYPFKKVTATGYTAGKESTGKHPGDPTYGITYSGVKVRRDYVSTIAADTSIFPIGTLLYIPGYGYGIVADTGSAINGYKLDLYYNSVKDVYKKWGKREVNVYIIKRGKGNLSEQTLDALNTNEALPVFQDQLNS